MPDVYWMFASKSWTERLVPSPRTEDPRATAVPAPASPAARRTSRTTIDVERRIRAQDVSRSVRTRASRFRVSPRCGPGVWYLTDARRRLQDGNEEAVMRQGKSVD